MLIKYFCSVWIALVSLSLSSLINIFISSLSLNEANSSVVAKKTAAKYVKHFGKCWTSLRIECFFGNRSCIKVANCETELDDFVRNGFECFCQPMNGMASRMLIPLANSLAVVFLESSSNRQLADHVNALLSKVWCQHPMVQFRCGNTSFIFVRLQTTFCGWLDDMARWRASTPKNLS